MLRFHRFHMPVAAERPAYYVFLHTLWLLRAQVY